MATHVVGTRVLVPRDFPRVRDIAREAFGESPWSDRDNWAALYARTDCVPLAGLVADQVVGWEVHAFGRDEFRVMALAVDSWWHLRGVGRALLAEVCRRARTYGVERVTAEVADANLGAHLFLRSCGWRAVRCAGSLYRFEVRL